MHNVGLWCGVLLYASVKYEARESGVVIGQCSEHSLVVDEEGEER